MINALTIDLEDWYHPELVHNHIQNAHPRITESTKKILQLLQKHNVKATFFILGEVAKKHPELITEIYQQGHEIASHGETHTPLWSLTPESFNQELKEYKAIIAKILGAQIKVYGFRAPTFSIDNTTKYAITCLRQNGFTYDTSIFPAKTPLYGVKDAPCTIYTVDENDVSKEAPNAEITEFPLTVYKKWGLTIPVSGGFYLRILPYWLLKRLLKTINKQRPFVIYFHPWETDPKTPRLKSIGIKNYLITYYGIGGALRKIEKLLNDFQFEPMKTVIQRGTQQ
jgi:polysaccharide deacetylase family protein (PEP-CTERM system associated)